MSGVAARQIASRRIEKGLRRQLLAAIGATIAAPIAFADDGQVCKATIAALMNRDPSIIKSKTIADGKVLVSYRHSGGWALSDGPIYTYKCRVKGSHVLWGVTDGRWRDHPKDSTITYTQSEDRITIDERFPDGSSIQKTFEIAPTE